MSPTDARLLYTPLSHRLLLLLLLLRLRLLRRSGRRRGHCPRRRWRRAHAARGRSRRLAKCRCCGCCRCWRSAAVVVAARSLLLLLLLLLLVSLVLISSRGRHRVWGQHVVVRWWHRRRRRRAVVAAAVAPVAAAAAAAVHVHVPAAAAGDGGAGRRALRPGRLAVLGVALHGARVQRQTRQVDAGADDALVVVGVHADGVGLQVERVLAVLDLLELVLVQVGPPPDAGVDDVREALPARHLQAAVERALDGHALRGVRAVRRDRRDQAVQLVALLLQLLHEALDGALRERLGLAALPVAHQRVHDAEARVGRRRSAGRRHARREGRGRPTDRKARPVGGWSSLLGRGTATRAPLSVEHLEVGLEERGEELESYRG